MVSAGTILTGIDAVATAPRESCTRACRLNVAAAVGVPESVPTPENESPEGTPPVLLHALPPEPPVLAADWL